jgi:S1-C subfamily serine protease
MPFFLGWINMAGHRWLYGVLIGIAIIGVSAGLYLYHWQSENTMSEQMQGNTSVLDLGVVYLPVTSNIANYYKLKMDSGALVTEVVKGSLVDQAGIKVGDVILSFNGVRVGESTPLLGMIRSCPMGHSITLAVWSNGNTRDVTLVHSGQ